jgi:hypothetical protein
MERRSRAETAGREVRRGRVKSMLAARPVHSREGHVGKDRLVLGSSYGHTARRFIFRDKGLRFLGTRAARRGFLTSVPSLNTLENTIRLYIFQSAP